jgi:hypothetical protein
MFARLSLIEARPGGLKGSFELARRRRAHSSSPDGVSADEIGRFDRISAGVAGRQLVPSTRTVMTQGGGEAPARANHDRIEAAIRLPDTLSWLFPLRVRCKVPATLVPVGAG